jgi:hypothetical protein
MASIDDLMATVCADCPNVWAFSCACNGWCERTGENLPDPPERDADEADKQAVRRRFIELLAERTPDHPWVVKYRETGR